ncbi:unnamed protein product [Orchesella dallaii]|uniref:C2H2-type domain-containing protein n=1 Tax=Orchesella dallaii TaxID=48710 RepID=A0ABP1RZK1_9HEXA
MGKVQFEINTKGICLLCLNHNKLCVGGRFIDNIKTLRMLLRYLKIDILQLCNFSPSFLQTMGAVEGSSPDVSITMCNNCCETTTKFYHFYEEFENIRMQLDKCVKSLYGSMLDGASRQDRVQEYERRIRTLSGTDILAASLGDSLKKEILQKCSLKVDASIPKVSLSKLNTTESNSSVSLTSTSSVSKTTTASTSDSRGNSERKNQTARRSGPKITIQARTAATPTPPTLTTAKTAENSVSNVSENSNNIMAISFGGTHVGENYLEEDEADPMVKVEVEMGPPDAEDSIPSEYNHSYPTNLMNSHYAYPNDSLRSISEMDVSSSSINHSHMSLNFGIGGNATNTGYNTTTATPGIFSAVINQRRQNDSYKCQDCGSCFASMQALHGHSAMHSNRSYSHPQVHRRTKQSSFTCKTCGKLFTSTSSLNQHIMLAHSTNISYFKHTFSKIRKYVPCDICGKSVRTDCLPRHKLIHSGETPFSCQYCNRKFRDISQQILHEKSLHTLEVFSKDLPHGTVLADIDGIINDVLTQMKRLSDSRTDKRYECPYCPRKLQEGQKSCSRTHILQKHFDKVQSLVKSRFGHFPIDETPILMENMEYASDIQQNHGMHQHQQFLDPLLNSYSQE